MIRQVRRVSGLAGWYNMPSPVFQAIVTTLDRSSPALATIKRGIEGLGNAATRAQVATMRLALVPLGRMRGAVAGLFGAFSHLRGHIGGVWSGLTSLMPPLAALGAGTSLAGIFGIVRHVAEAREELTHMAETIGVTPAQLARLNYVARMTGTNVEGMHFSMTRLNRVMALSAAGKNKDALALFQRMGVSIDELRTGNAATILPKIAGAFQATENATLRTRMAFALFGRSGAQMIPLLAQGPEVMRRWTQELDRLAYKFTDTDDKGLTRFRMSWIGLETSVGGFINVLGARLAPVLEPAVAQFRDWIANNRKWIATQISEKVGEFVKWLQQLDWRAIGRQVRDFVRGVSDLIDKLGGVKVAMLAVVGITFSPVIAGLLQIGVVVARLVLAFGTTLVAAIGAAGDAMVAFNARTLALPIFSLLTKFFALGLPLALGGDTARNEETAAAEKAAREGKLDEWQRQNPTLGERLWRWMLSPPAGMPAPGAGGGAGDTGGAMPFGPQLVPMLGQRSTGRHPAAANLPEHLCAIGGAGCDRSARFGRRQCALRQRAAWHAG